MLRVISCIALLGLAGCSSRGPSPVAPVDLPNRPGSDWFCEMNPSGEDWNCVQDKDLARHPKPSRLPEPKPPPAPIISQPAPASPAPPLNESASAPREPVKSVPALPRSPQPSSQRIPKHVRLAYKPEEPVNIVDLPPEFYAVQLIALSSRDELESFVSDNRLEGMSAARVANDGAVFYVLLLGIYETAAIAKEAAEDISPPLDKFEPWVRRLGSLQQAMIRADEIGEYPGSQPG